MPKNFKTFEEGVGLSFNNLDLLRQAFTHRSYLNQHRTLPHPHKQQLEFLGDAVLELIVTRFLYEKFPEQDEGDLTAYRAALVNAVTLSAIAGSIGMDDYLLLSRGEAKDKGRARQMLLANALEALVGAIYLDQGYEAAQVFLEKRLFPKIDEIVQKGLWQDSKSSLQENAQETEGVTPSYKVMREWGPDHDKHFTVGVYIKERLVAEGEGKSKQEAEQAAAHKALAAKGW